MDPKQVREVPIKAQEIIEKTFDQVIEENHKEIEVHPEKDKIEKLFDMKGRWKDHFAHAVLTQDVVMRVWNGNHPVEKNTTEHTAKAGTKVLITTVSRFGDLGVRDRKIDAQEHGYFARVGAATLKDITILSEDDGRDPKREAYEAAVKGRQR